TPRLNLSTLNRLPLPQADAPCPFRYRVKVQNASRRHGVADLDLHARLVIRGLDESRPATQTSLLIPVGSRTPFPILDPRRRSSEPEDYERVYTLHVHDLHGNALDRLPPNIRDGLKDRTVPLEQLLQLGTRAF